MMQLHFGHNRAAAFAVAWNLASEGHGVKLWREAGAWFVSIAGETA